MPKYQVTSPTGQMFEVNAPDGATQDQVLAYAKANMPAAAPAPAPSFLGDVSGAVSGAVDRLKGDAVSAYQGAAKTQPVPVAKLLGDVAGVVASPFAGAIHAVARPIAGAMDQIPLQPYAAPQLTMQGGRLGLTAPRALSPQEAHDRNQAAVEQALTAGRAPELAAANVAANPFSDMAQRFNAANVTPLAAAAGGKGAATMTNVVAENPIAGAAVRARLRNAVDQTAASAQDIAGRYGETRGPQITGENVQQGVQAFAQDKDLPTSFAAKAGARYDDVFNKLDTAMAAKTSPGAMRPVADDQFAYSAPVGGSQITTPATTATLGGINNSTQSAAIGDLIADPTLSKAAKALTNADQAKDLSFNDLRRLRTWVRDAKDNPDLRQSIGSANLSKLEGSLTQDIYSNAETLGSPDLARQLRRADQYYAAGSQRISDALQPFADAKSGEGAYARVLQAAGSTAAADAQRLLSLKRSLTPDEWGDVASNAVSEMGKQTPGTSPAGEQGFSVSSFVTNYNKMSPRGKDIMFGAMGGGGQRATQLRSALANLASVADNLKGVEKGANTSKSFVNAQAFGTIGGLSNHITAVPTAIGLGGMALTGEAMTNPLVVRWLTRLSGAQKAGPGAVGMVVKQLGNAARANVALGPIYQESMKLLAPPTPLLTKAAAGTQKQQPAQ